MRSSPKLSVVKLAAKRRRRFASPGELGWWVGVMAMGAPDWVEQSRMRVSPRCAVRMEKEVLGCQKGVLVGVEMRAMELVLPPMKGWVLWWVCLPSSGSSSSSGEGGGFGGVSRLFFCFGDVSSPWGLAEGMDEDAVMKSRSARRKEYVRSASMEDGAAPLDSGSGDCVEEDSCKVLDFVMTEGLREAPRPPVSVGR